jgi:hypothetical protein
MQKHFKEYMLPMSASELDAKLVENTILVTCMLVTLGLEVRDIVRQCVQDVAASAIAKFMVGGLALLRCLMHVGDKIPRRAAGLLLHETSARKQLENMDIPGLITWAKVAGISKDDLDAAEALNLIITDESEYGPVKDRGYRKLIGCMLWPTRNAYPMISYAISQLCRCMEKPSEKAWE